MGLPDTTSLSLARILNEMESPKDVRGLPPLRLPKELMPTKLFQELSTPPLAGAIGKGMTPGFDPKGSHQVGWMISRGRGPISQG